MVATSVPRTVHWIDGMVGVAYVSIRCPLGTFRESLDAIDDVIIHPRWRPGMPIVEDLRPCAWDPPSGAIHEWRAYILRRRPFLEGSRWAVVRTPDQFTSISILDQASSDAAAVGLELRQFSSMTQAHLWVAGTGQASAVAARRLWRQF